ncbi:EamA family transporter [Aromatoleum petrolei]|uniref:EamA family transporter n=1 Tax=Aromatoleum petrolei TaxID=76116 RepID=A0ABX1MXC5_9RHOO|nr:EamA family transporter [Aromatoleum petrolei]
MSDPKNYRLGFWLAVGAAAGFSAKAVLVKLAYAVPNPALQGTAVDAVTLLALRMLFAAPAFGIAALHTRGANTLGLKHWLALVGVGLAGYYGASILDFWGLAYISAGLERLILFTYPSLTLLIGVIFLRKRLSRRDWLALLLTYVGIAVAFAHDLHLAADSTAIWTGTALVFLSSLAYAIYLAGGGELIGRLGGGRFTALAMAIATVATLTHYLLSRPWAEIFNQPWQIYVLALGMAVFSTVVPVFMQSAAIKHIGAGRASMIGMLGPVATIALSSWLLDEPLSFWQLAGAAIVIVGVALISKR